MTFPGQRRPDEAPAPISETAPRPIRSLHVAGLAVVAVAISIGTAVLATRGASTLALISPAAAAAGIGLVVLACWRFEWFVLCVLSLRTLVDVTKIRPTASQLTPGISQPPTAVSSGPAASALAVLFIVVATVWLLVQRRGRPAMRLTAPDAAFAFFVTACLLSTLGSVSRTGTLTESARILAAVLMFVVLQRLLTEVGQVRRVLIACAVAFVAPVGLGIIQALTGGGYVIGGVSRIVGSFLHPNTFGFFLTMFILMAVALLPHTPVRASWLLCAGGVVCSVLLLLTYSRGAWVALVVGLVVLGVLQTRVIFVVMIAGAAVSLAVPSVLSRITNLASTTTTTGSSGNSLIWRLTYWTQISVLNRNNPVTGIGLKSTKFLTDQSKAPHNDFLRAYVETGALGLLAFLVVLAVLLTIAHRALRTTTSGLPRGVAVGFAAVLAAYLIDSLGDNLLSEVVVLWYFYAVAACAAAISTWRSPPALAVDRVDPPRAASVTGET